MSSLLHKRLRQGAILSLAFLSTAAMATDIGSSLPITQFLNQFTRLLTSDIVRGIGLSCLVFAIITFAWSQLNGNEATGLFKTLGIAGMAVAALCGVGQIFSWMGYGLLVM